MQQSVFNYMESGEVVAQRTSINDIWTAIEWLTTYESDASEDENVQALVNVIASLERQIQRKENRAATKKAQNAYKRAIANAITTKTQAK